MLLIFSSTSTLAFGAFLVGFFAAGLAAGLGNCVADLLGGWGFWFDWSVGNAVLGLFVGALPLYGAYIEDGIFEIKHMIFDNSK